MQCINITITPETTIETLKHKLTHNKLDKEYYNIDENGLLTRKVIDGGHEFHAIYLPAVLVLQVLHAAHDDLGHNGFPRTYCYIVGLGLNCKFFALLFKRLVITFIKISFLNCFIVSEIIYSQTDTLTEELMYLR